MRKISGRISNTPPTPPKDGNMHTMAVPIGTPIEGVKVTDGNKNVFSDKDGKYEITTDKQFLTFSKEKYISQTIDLYGGGSPWGLPNVRIIVLKKSDDTTTETKSTSEEKTLFGLKQKFLVNVAIVLGVVGLGWYFYKSKK